MRHAAHFGFGIQHGVEANPFTVPNLDAARLAKVHVAGEFAHDHDVEA